MGTLITDEMLREFAVVEEPDHVISKFKTRYSDLVDRTTLSVPVKSPERRAELLAELQS